MGVNKRLEVDGRAGDGKAGYFSSIQRKTLQADGVPGGPAKEGK